MGFLPYNLPYLPTYLPYNRYKRQGPLIRTTYTICTNFVNFFLLICATHVSYRAVLFLFYSSADTHVLHRFYSILTNILLKEFNGLISFTKPKLLKLKRKCWCILLKIKKKNLCAKQDKKWK